jgi:hypothetical protein
MAYGSVDITIEVKDKLYEKTSIYVHIDDDKKEIVLLPN